MGSPTAPECTNLAAGVRWMLTASFCAWPRMHLSLLPLLWKGLRQPGTVNIYLRVIDDGCKKNMLGITRTWEKCMSWVCVFVWKISGISVWWWLCQVLDVKASWRCRKRMGNFPITSEQWCPLLWVVSEYSNTDLASFVTSGVSLLNHVKEGKDLSGFSFNWRSGFLLSPTLWNCVKGLRDNSV